MEAIKEICEVIGEPITSKILSINVDHLSKCLNNACKVGDFDKVKHIIDSDALPCYDINTLYYACVGNNLKIINFVDEACECKHGPEIINILWYHGLLGLCEIGDINLFKSCLNKTTHSDKFWNECLLASCESGNIDLVKFVVNQGTIYTRYWNKGMFIACENGHVAIVEFIISKNIKIYKGKNKHEQIDKWDMGLEAACAGGNIKIVKIMISKGANNWNGGLKSACVKGNLKIVKFMISKGANYWEGIESACYGGNLKIVKFLTKYDTETVIFNLNSGLYGACKGGNMNVVKYMISKGASNWDAGMTAACEGGNLEIIELMISNGMDFDDFLYIVCKKGYTNIVEHMINNNMTVWDNVMCDACLEGNLEIVELAINNVSVSEVVSGLANACDRKHIIIVRFILSRYTIDLICLNHILCEYMTNNYNYYIYNSVDINIINLLISAGANNFECLSNIKHFKLYCLYCKYVNITPNKNRYNNLLRKYPAYVLFVGSRVNRLTKHCSVKRLPVELFRLLFEY